MKLPVSEYIDHLQSLDLEGKIKYLLNMVQKHIIEIETLQIQIREHYQAHQAVNEAREKV